MSQARPASSAERTAFWKAVAGGRVRAPIFVSVGLHALAGLAIALFPRSVGPPEVEPPAFEIAFEAPQPVAKEVSAAGPTTTPTLAEPPPAEPEPVRVPDPAPPAVEKPPPAVEQPPVPVPVKPAPPKRLTQAPRAKPQRPLPQSRPPQSAEPTPAQASSVANPAEANDGWQTEFSEWIKNRRNYPDQARLRGIEGVVSMRIVVAPDGQVLDAQIAHGSGSEILDEATVAIFRGSRVPSFHMPVAQMVVTIGIRYRLEGR